MLIIKCGVALKANLSDNAAMREARLHDAEAELARSIGSCARLSQVSDFVCFFLSIADSL